MKLHIAALIMVKNEHKRLHITLNSIKNFADSLIVFDTGSTDNTIDICKEFCEKNNIPLRLKEGEFINFCISRNESLDFGDMFEDVNYFLLLDTNDELRNGNDLRKFAEDNLNSEKTSFLISQEWWSGSLTKYYNSRLMKSRSGWRFSGVVHEYLEHPNNKDDCLLGRAPDHIVLYQDRTQDDDKTSKRFIRDEKLLKEEYIKDPKEPRTIFYLAQTYSCLNDLENAYYFYKLRTTLIGFYEERYHASFLCGEIGEKLGLDWYDCMSWYMKAYELIPRAEPMVKIGEYYQSKEKWDLSYTFHKLACSLNYPDSCILFIDRFIYTYKRWHLLGIVSFYAGNFEEGKQVCQVAIKNGKEIGVNTDIDHKNLDIYVQREKHISKNVIQVQDENNHNNLVNKILTKNEFINTKIEELKKQNLKLTDKQLYTRAKLMWKNKK